MCFLWVGGGAAHIGEGESTKSGMCKEVWMQEKVICVEPPLVCGGGEGGGEGGGGDGAVGDHSKHDTYGTAVAS